MSAQPIHGCVIFNPAAGRGRAGRRLERLVRSWQGETELWPTTHRGHARELAQTAAEKAFQFVGAAGGDGTVHEVANGMLDVAESQAMLKIVPVGSANDLAASLRQQFGVAVADEQGVAVDVGRVTGDRGRSEHFVCGCGLGLNGQVTLESQRIRWLQGLPLYGWASLRAVWRMSQVPNWTMQFDDEFAIETPTRMLSVLLARREGNFTLAPEALHDDGLFDILHIGAMSRFEMLHWLPRVALNGPPKNHPLVLNRRCRRVRVTSNEPLTVHHDGEMFCVPDDGVCELTAELLPARLRVQVVEPV